MRRLLILTAGLSVILAGSTGAALAQESNAQGISTDPLVWEGVNAGAPDQAAPQVDPVQIATPGVLSLEQETTEDVTAVDGDAAALGPGSASASPGSVTRGVDGNALLGPDGTYNVTEVAPPNVSVSGDTDLISITPAAAAAPAPETAVAGCSSYLSWYDAQVAYEAAGMTGADPAMVEALDPDYDGIACEEAM